VSSFVTLSAAVRADLPALQDTTSLPATTQQRPAIGKKVNSALDNPADVFTAATLSARAGQLPNLLDAMTNAIDTLEAADDGLTSITTTLQSMQATVTRARQDASWQSTSYSLDTAAIGTATVKNLSFSGGAVGTTAVGIALNAAGATATTVTASAGYVAPIAASGPVATPVANFLPLQTSNGDETYSFTVSRNGGAAVNVRLDHSDGSGGKIDTLDAAWGINTDLTAGGSTIRAGVYSGSGWSQLVFYDTDDANTGRVATITVSDVTTGGTAPSGTLGWEGGALFGQGANVFGAGRMVTPGSAGAGAVKTVDQLVAAINTASNLSGKVTASNNAGQLQITNLSTTALTVTGISASTGRIDGGNGTGTIAGNATRAKLVGQFNRLKEQLDKTASDASHNGINLLQGDHLELFFSQSSTSAITIQSTNTAGVSSLTLGVGAGTNAEFQGNSLLDARLQSLQTGLTTVASQASAFGANLAIVQNRQTFTNSMVNMLQTGSDGLPLADRNLEGANMLALQTRQQLSIQALSLESQANQAVLRLFG
jgi:flagellin